MKCKKCKGDLMVDGACSVYINQVLPYANGKYAYFELEEEQPEISFEEYTYCADCGEEYTPMQLLKK